jgi:hypothetical protein
MGRVRKKKRKKKKKKKGKWDEKVRWAMDGRRGGGRME